ncbi:MAG: transposase [Chitinophagaceae bacterium]|nr:transposase [Chitinophagaceae bacterium]
MQYIKGKGRNQCTLFPLCTKHKKERLIVRSGYQPYVDSNKLNVEADTKTYKLHQQIIEHTYGIVKRQCGLYYVVTKRSMKRVRADPGLMFTALNLRRIMNLVDKKLLQKFLQALWLSALALTGSYQIHSWLLCSVRIFAFRMNTEKSASLNGLL